MWPSPPSFFFQTTFLLFFTPSLKTVSRDLPRGLLSDSAEIVFLVLRPCRAGSCGVSIRRVERGTQLTQRNGGEERAIRGGDVAVASRVRALLLLSPLLCGLLRCLLRRHWNSTPFQTSRIFVCRLFDIAEIAQVVKFFFSFSFSVLFKEPHKASVESSMLYGLDKGTRFRLGSRSLIERRRTAASIDRGKFSML